MLEKTHRWLLRLITKELRKIHSGHPRPYRIKSHNEQSPTRFLSGGEQTARQQPKRRGLASLPAFLIRFGHFLKAPSAHRHERHDDTTLTIRKLGPGTVEREYHVQEFFPMQVEQS